MILVLLKSQYLFSLDPVVLLSVGCGEFSTPKSCTVSVSHAFLSSKKRHRRRRISYTDTTP